MKLIPKRLAAECCVTGERHVEDRADREPTRGAEDIKHGLNHLKSHVFVGENLEAPKNLEIFRTLVLPSGKRLHKTMETHYFEWENSRTFYGHFP